ncbi:MAG: hypothetical protein V4714_12125 [Bacteroidota bacterium]
MKTNEEDLIRLLDITDSIQEIQGYIGQSEYNEFATRDDIKEAVVSQLQQIGGAAALLSDEFKEKYRDIDWNVLAGLQYGSYDQQLELDMMPHWYIVHNDFPQMLIQISDIATELRQATDLENELMDDDAGESESGVEARIENEAYQNQRISEHALDGDLENEDNVDRDLRDKQVMKSFIDDIQTDGLTEAEKKVLNAISHEANPAYENELEMESLDDMDINSIDIEDDSFIDQRYEDVDLMGDSSLDDEAYPSDGEYQRETE